jgi:chromosome segregation ATPase
MSDGVEALGRKPKASEESIPAWIKIFGGSVISVLFLCVITVIGYVVNNLNSLQIQINTLNSQTITKEENSQQHKVIWDTFSVQLKGVQETLAPVKERVNSLEQLVKERQGLHEKLESRLFQNDKSLENLNKETILQKERATAQDQQVMLLRDEIKNIQRDVQALREKIIGIEAKMK